MSLNFCCDIQMVVSDFGVSNMKGWTHPALSGWYWCNGVGGNFLRHFGLLSTIWISFKRHSPLK